MDGITNIYFPVSALFIIVLLTILFFSKTRVNNIETRIYKWLIIINLLESLFACTIVSFAVIDGSVLVLEFLDKLDYILILTWVWLLFVYTCMLVNQNKKILKITGIINIIIYILILFTNIIIINKNGVMDSNGMSYNILFCSIIIYLILTICFAFIGLFRNISKSKYVPIVSLLMLIIAMVIIRVIRPELVLLSFIMSFVTLIMYHTIENPDVKMINELELAKNQAEKANRAKTDFLSSMSHEIRTPLNAIVGLSEMIQENDNIDEIHEDASDIVSASNTLLEIVNGILDISKIEADKMEIVKVSYNPLEEFKSLVNLVESRIGEKDIKLRTDFAVDLPNTLYGDKGKVKQIITNLLTNAVKYTEKGYIDFKVTCINEKDISKLTITVSDTGRGIKKEQMNNLFTKFNRLEEDKNTTIEGTGLGLAITKALTEMMGGKVVVDSTYGEGSKFTVFLSQKITNDNSLNKEEEKLDNFKGNRVLIVDDNKLNIKVASKILKEFDLDIDECESGFECISKIENGEVYNAIFMDIMMPKMSGVETLKKLKQIENFNTPVVALTADAIMGKSNKYLEVGFNDYLSKPIDKNKLNNVLNRVLNHIEIDEEVSDDPNIHKIIPITDEDIAELNKLFGEPTVITKEEVEKRNKEKNKA